MRNVTHCALGLAVVALLCSVTHAEADDAMAAVGPGELYSVLPPSEAVDVVHVRAFLLDKLPVTNGQFLAFVGSHPQWRRDEVVRLFADAGYLARWRGPFELGSEVEVRQPVTDVSWFAATAYCESRDARLPTWWEWEFAAAADESRADARDDAVWRQKILSAFTTTGNETLNPVGEGRPNFYGIHDLHGLVWEWVQDYNALLVGADNREQGGADKLKFCGAGALAMENKDQYAVLMRVALLSSMEAAYTTRNLGFRCAHDDRRDAQ